MREDLGDQRTLSRRGLLSASAAAVAGGMIAPALAAEPTGKAIERGRLKQSIVEWCFAKHWDLEKTCQVAQKLGCQSVELVPPDRWDILKRYGLVCAVTPSHMYVQGMNNPKFHEMCLAKMRAAIDATADAGFPAVITFTGFAEDIESPEGKRSAKIAPDEGIRNCVEGYKKIVGYAEKKKVNLTLEMLNSRVSEQMKGHPGYQGDHVDYCIDIIKQVGSPRLGLLFDIYHVQIMDGDVIRRIHECKEHINHVHTAGNPGRGELDGPQEINYPPIMQALCEIDYKGYVGQEFIPTRDPLVGLTAAVKLCDV